MNSASSTAVGAKPPRTCGEAQPQSSALTRARASAPIATREDRGAEHVRADLVGGQPPGRCPVPLAAARSGARTRTPKIRAIATTGTLTRNTQCQLAATRAPPRTGPSAAAAPPTEVHARIAPVRRSGGAAASSRLSEAGMSSAPPAAWTTRAPTRTQTSGAAAQAAEASAKMIMPVRNAARRPIRSAARPAGTSSAANTIA